MSQATTTTTPGTFLPARSCRRVSVCPSVTSRCSTETAKRRISQSSPYDSIGLRFSGAENVGKTQTWLPQREALNADLDAAQVAGKWRLSTRSVVNLARSVARLSH